MQVKDLKKNSIKNQINKKSLLYSIGLLFYVLFIAYGSISAYDFGKHATSEQIADAFIIYFGFIIILYTLFIYAVYKINEKSFDKRKRKNDNTISI